MEMFHTLIVVVVVNLTVYICQNSLNYMLKISGFYL